MELEVGMYVRTASGYIYKLGYYNETEKRWICVEKYDWYPVYESSVIKASHNIIDLIEVGDYVNGIEINSKDEKGVYHGAYDCYDEAHFTNPKDIKSIVTKEQFESMQYRLGD